MSHEAFKDGDMFATQASGAVPDDMEIDQLPTKKMHVADLRRPFSPEDLNGEMTLIYMGELSVFYPPSGDAEPSRKILRVWCTPARDEEELDKAANQLKGSIFEEFMRSEGPKLIPRISSSIHRNALENTTTVFAALVSYRDKNGIDHEHYVLPTLDSAKLMIQKLQQGGDYTRVVRVPNR